VMAAGARASIESCGAAASMTNRNTTPRPSPTPPPMYHQLRRRIANRQIFFGRAANRRRIAISLAFGLTSSCQVRAAWVCEHPPGGRRQSPLLWRSSHRQKW
jgi:hypothetical protein